MPCGSVRTNVLRVLGVSNPRRLLVSMILQSVMRMHLTVHLN